MTLTCVHSVHWFCSWLWTRQRRCAMKKLRDDEHNKFFITVHAVTLWPKIEFMFIIWPTSLRSISRIRINFTASRVTTQSERTFVSIISYISEVFLSSIMNPFLIKFALFTSKSTPSYFSPMCRKTALTWSSSAVDYILILFINFKGANHSDLNFKSVSIFFRAKNIMRMFHPLKF